MLHRSLVASSLFSLLAIAASGLTAAACAAPTQDGSDGTDEADSTGGHMVITASTVQALKGSLSSITPSVRTADPGHTPASYLDPESALGGAGPLGAWGPLGALGPVGDNSWNASAWMSAVGDWSEWSGDMTKHKGPLSASGPLGPKGPLSDDAYLVTLPGINDWCKQLQAGGVFTALGPVGPLGALGPLGPLGPIGAHGFAPDDDGAYRHGNAVVRTVDVQYPGDGRSDTRTYELVEKYTEAFAKKMKDNDTSFMVIGAIDDAGHETDTYAMTSADAQFVTVVVVPENALSDFDFTLTKADGKTIVTSSSDGSEDLSIFGVPSVTGHYVDFAQIKVAAGEGLKVKVTAKTTNAAFPTYRLIVTGSTKYIGTTDIKGKHQAFR